MDENENGYLEECELVHLRDYIGDSYPLSTLKIPVTMDDIKKDALIVDSIQYTFDRIELQNSKWESGTQDADFVFLKDSSYSNTLSVLLAKPKKSVICINDDLYSLTDDKNVKNAIERFYESWFPKKSVFEL